MSVEALARVLSDCPLRGTQKLVMIGIANHAGDGGSWPSLDTLATYASVSRRNAQKAVESLAEDGWIVRHIQEGGTRKMRADRRPNRYDICWDRFDGASVATPGESERGVGSDVDGASVATPEPSFNHPKAKSLESKALPVPTETGVSEHRRPEPLPTSQGLEPRDEFEEFWNVYPRKVGKGRARPAWARAVKKAGAPAVLAAARAFAAQRAGEDPTFTPHPASWLNAERWDDEAPAVWHPSARASHLTRKAEAVARMKARAAERIADQRGHVIDVYETKELGV